MFRVFRCETESGFHRNAYGTSEFPEYGNINNNKITLISTDKP